MRWRRPAQFSVRLSVPFVGEVAGVWEPADAERRAAWELYVELVTRVTVVQLGPNEGMLREALTSFYSLFGTTRGILRKYGPAVAPRRGPGQLSFGALAITILNGALRPVLARWHPRLAAYEARRPADADPVAYERSWEHADELRAELARARKVLADLARILADVAGAAHVAGTDPADQDPPDRAGGGLVITHRRGSRRRRLPVVSCRTVLTPLAVAHKSSLSGGWWPARSGRHMIPLRASVAS